MITPTVGRIVWYHPSMQDGLVVNGNQPMAAQVVYVWSDRCVSLLITDHAGNQKAKTSVALRQDDEPAPPYGYCEWMPYQKTQAAK